MHFPFLSLNQLRSFIFFFLSWISWSWECAVTKQSLQVHFYFIKYMRPTSPTIILKIDRITVFYWHNSLMISWSRFLDVSFPFSLLSSSSSSSYSFNWEIFFFRLRSLWIQHNLKIHAIYLSCLCRCFFF